MRLDLCFSLSQTSIVEFMKPKCLWTKNKKKKRQAQAKEQQQQQEQMKMVKELTLEECLSASPGYAHECKNGGHEYHVLKTVF
jgi:hypothetical protein